MSSNSLPPGLITRNGTPVSRNQRLPSLKNSPNLQLPQLSNSSFTKGGAAKRQFKPKIPTSRSINSVDSSVDASSNEIKEKLKREPRTKDVKNRVNKKKELLQLDAVVFNGISAPLSSNRNSGESFRNVGCSAARSKRKFEVNKCEKEVKTEIDWEKSLYKDDFIDYSDDDCYEETPKGWENFSSTNYEKKSLVEKNADLMNFNNFIKDGDELEKLLLFQIPDLFVKKPEGKIGKLRFFKSGKIELIDEESRLQFDIFKSSDKKCAKNQKNVIQEVVSLSNNQLTCFGSLKSSDVYVAVPTIPDDLQS